MPYAVHLPITWKWVFLTGAQGSIWCTDSLSLV